MSQVAVRTRDVIELVLEHLAGDAQAVRAATLVHPSWTEPCQQRLFYVVEIGRQQGRYDEEWQGLISCLLASTHIREYIRTLVVWGWGASTANDVLAGHDLARLFPRVSRLVLHRRLIMGLTLALPKLEHLECGHSVPLRSLQEGFEDPYVYTGCVPHTTPRLLTLCISHNLRNQEDVLSWIQSVGVADDLHMATLSCPPLPGTSRTFFISFLSSRRPNFSKLVLDMTSSSGQGYNPSISLGVVPHVKELKLITWTRGSGFIAILELLCSTQFPALHTLEIQITRWAGYSDTCTYRPFPSYKSLQSDSWRLSDELLRQLQRVLVVLVDIDTVRGFEDVLSAFSGAGKPDLVQVEAGRARFLPRVDDAYSE